jgi:hypothetical protein
MCKKDLQTRGGGRTILLHVCFNRPGLLSRERRSVSALSAESYTTTLPVMEAVVSCWKLLRLLTVAMSKQEYSARKLKCYFFIIVFKLLLTNVF